MEGNQDVAVFVLENLQVEQVMVHAGQTVEKKGIVLLKLSQNSIQAALKNLDDKVKNSGRAGKGSGKSEKGEQPEACSGAGMGWKLLRSGCAKRKCFRG